MFRIKFNHSVIDMYSPVVLPIEYLIRTCADVPITVRFCVT